MKAPRLVLVETEGNCGGCIFKSVTGGKCEILEAKTAKYFDCMPNEEINHIFMLQSNSKLEKLDSEQFYDLMQDYRHAPVQDQEEVTRCFDNVKNFVRGL